MPDCDLSPPFSVSKSVSATGLHGCHHPASTRPGAHMTTPVHPPATATEADTTRPGIPSRSFRKRPKRPVRHAFSPDTGPTTRAPRLAPPRDTRPSADGSWEPGPSSLRDRPKPTGNARPAQAPTAWHTAAPTRLEQREWTGAATAGHHVAGIAAPTPHAGTAGRTATHHRAPGRAARPLPPPGADAADAGPATPAGAGDGQ